MGSYLEYYVIDRRHVDREAMLQRWQEYLRIAWKTEPVGQHYLRRILMVFKFELNLPVAIIATIPGMVALAYYGVLPIHGLGAILGLTVLVSYLYRASVASSKLLDGLREQLLSQARSTGEFK